MGRRIRIVYLIGFFSSARLKHKKSFIPSPIAPSTLPDYRRERFRDPVLGWVLALFPTWSSFSFGSPVAHRTGNSLSVNPSLSARDSPMHEKNLRSWKRYGEHYLIRLMIVRLKSMTTSTSDLLALKPNFLGNKVPDLIAPTCRRIKHTK